MSAILDVGEVLGKYRLPADFKAVLEELLERNVDRANSAATGSSKTLSMQTQKYRTMTLGKSFEELRQNGFALQSPYSLKHKHVQFLVNFWLRRKLARGTIENKLTYLRALADWTRKPNLVGTLADYVDMENHDLLRSHVPRIDKSWVANGIDAEAKIEEVAATDRNVAVQLKLQAAFGLRVEESFLLRPAEAIRDDGLLHVTRGTRDGRNRLVPIGLRLAVLEEAAELSNLYTGSTIPHGYTKQQWRERYYHVLRKHGVRKAATGVTSHGLRHQFLQQMYETLAGAPAPIKQQRESTSTKLHREARQRVVQAAGHTHVSKSNAYLTMKNAATVRVSRELTPEAAKRAIVEARGVKSQAAANLGISRQALYRLLERDG